MASALARYVDPGRLVAAGSTRSGGGCRSPDGIGARHHPAAPPAMQRGSGARAAPGLRSRRSDDDRRCPRARVRADPRQVPLPNDGSLSTQLRDQQAPPRELRRDQRQAHPPGSTGSTRAIHVPVPASRRLAVPRDSWSLRLRHLRQLRQSALPHPRPSVAESQLSVAPIRSRRAIAGPEQCRVDLYQPLAPFTDFANTAGLAQLRERSIKRMLAAHCTRSSVGNRVAIHSRDPATLAEIE